MQTIYFLQNSLDYKIFLDYLRSINVLLCTTSGEICSIYDPNFNHCRGCIYYIVDGTNNHGAVGGESATAKEKGIEFLPSYQIDSYWQLGLLSLRTSSASTNSSIFKAIIKYFKKNYILSTDKKFYIGVGMYDDWLNYKINFLSLFRYQKINVDYSTFDFKHFKDYISQKGYIVKGDGLDIRKPYDESLADGFVIYSNECKVITRICARREFFTCNSQCIFLIRDRKKYSFIIDERLLSPSFEPIFNLRDLIISYLSDHNC